MNVDEIIESWVRDVVACLPRGRRADVAFELHALLQEDLAARAEAAGRAPDKAMALALLKDFGRPAAMAQLYHARPALVAAADTHHFLIWALGGAVVLVTHTVLGHPDTDVGGLFLQWLGLLLLCFAAIDWMRRRRPHALHWTPSRGPEWTPRWLSALSLACLLVFPVAMYAAPMEFARWLLPDAVRVDGLALTAAFAGSWQRGVTQGLLVALALLEGVALVAGRRPRWTRRAGAAVSLALGTMFVAHASPMTPFGGGAAFEVFALAHANAVAAPVFLAVGGMMILFGLYYAWQEWSLIRPQPSPPRSAAA
ncbi:MAG TPA: hypothetical protein PLO34_02250 [Pseudoxanthomonas sp.]|nr:hypothetical protein [Pseudoxanthomonas sp.]